MKSKVVTSGSVHQLERHLFQFLNQILTNWLLHSESNLHHLVHLLSLTVHLSHTCVHLGFVGPEPRQNKAVLCSLWAAETDLHISKGFNGADAAVKPLCNSLALATCWWIYEQLNPDFLPQRIKSAAVGSEWCGCSDERRELLVCGAAYWWIPIDCVARACLRICLQIYLIIWK